MSENKDSKQSESITRECPAELSSRLPRRVRMDTGGGRFLLVTVVFCFGWGASIFCYHAVNSIKQVQQRDALRREGRETMGTVIMESSHRGAPASVSYVFSFGGITYSGNAQLPAFGKTIIHKSGPIAVLFLPSNPSVNHPESWEWTVLGEIDVAEILMLFLITMGCIALIRALKDRKLAREGMAAEATAIACSPVKAGFHVKYEFRTEDGLSIRGSCDCAEEVEEGSKIWILYLSQRPKRNHSYPMEFFSVVE